MLLRDAFGVTREREEEERVLATVGDPSTPSCMVGGVERCRGGFRRIGGEGKEQRGREEVL